MLRMLQTTDVQRGSSGSSAGPFACGTARAETKPCNHRGLRSGVGTGQCALERAGWIGLSVRGMYFNTTRAIWLRVDSITHLLCLSDMKVPFHQQCPLRSHFLADSSEGHTYLSFITKGPVPNSLHRGRYASTSPDPVISNSLEPPKE